MSCGEKESQGMGKMATMATLWCMLVLGGISPSPGEARYLQLSGCGEPPKFQKRIARGVDAAQGRHPYMASLQEYSYYTKEIEHFCGGVLVAPNYILTAAHCIKDFSFPTVVLGIDKLSIDIDTLLNGERQDFKTCRTIVHEAYNAEGKKEHDIALIQISQDSDIFPVALNKEKVDPGREVRALGWGRTETQRLSNELQQLELEVMSNPKCSETYRETFSDCDKCIVPTIKDGMMCAQARIQADVCKGDSGGPIVLTPGAGQDKNACNDVLVGITSRGLRCNDEVRGLQNPGIFTRVSEYISWIENRGQNQGKIRVNPYIEDTCFERPEDTEDDRYPYVVSIQSGGSHICEGVLVASNVVLTAAQCVEHDPFPTLKIGSRYLANNDPRKITEQINSDSEEMFVCTTILHEKYEEDPAHYDLALLVLSTDSLHTPVTISTERLTPEQGARVVSWGAKRSSGRAHYSELRWLDIQITPDGGCDNRTTVEVVPSFQSALGLPLILPQKGKNADDPTRDVLFGIGGIDSECNTDTFSYPRVFIQTADFASWIGSLGERQDKKFTRENPDRFQCFRFEPTCVFLFNKWIGNNCTGKPVRKVRDP